MKRCSKCGKEKEPTTANFGRCTTTRDHLRPECKDCQAEYQAAYAITNALKLKTYFRSYYQANATTIKDRSRQHELANPDAARQRKHGAYEQTAEVVKERERQRYANNREQRQTQQRRYHRNNPQAARASGQRRRARLASLPTNFKLRDWRTALSYFSGKCAACQTEARLVMDHWQPVSRGGGTTTDNIVPLCAPCNANKHNRRPEEWLRQRFGDGAVMVSKKIDGYFSQLKEQI
jgi:5-methylcytosine-specific restriction endonuclease McrA